MTPTPDKGVERWEFSLTVAGSAKWHSLAVCHKTKHTFAVSSSNLAPRDLPKGGENLYLHKNLQTDVYSTFLHNFQTLEAAKISFGL